MPKKQQIEDYRVSRTGINRLCLSFCCLESVPGPARLEIDPRAGQALLFRDDVDLFIFKDFPSDMIEEIGFSGGILIAERDPPRAGETEKFPYLPADFAPVRRFYEASVILRNVAAPERPQQETVPVISPAEKERVG